MNETGFSIVVPTYNRPDRLVLCLQALAHLNYPRERFEVIVVDDGSPEPIVRHSLSFRDRLDLRLVRQDRAGPAAARNTGARIAKFEHLAFTDDDCTPDPGWLGAFARALADTPDAMAGGRTINVLGNNIYAVASQSIVDFLYSYYGAERGNAPFFTSNNLVAPRRQFLDLGGFDETFQLAAAEDRELGMRWRQEVGRLRFVHDAIVGHAHPLTLRRFLRQHANYGRGARHLSRVTRAVRLAGHRIEPPRFYLGLALHPFGRGLSTRALAESGLIVLSQFAMTWGYAEEWQRSSGKTFERA